MPFDPRQRPTAEDIDRQEKVLRDVWQAAHKAMEEADAYYFRQNNIWDRLKQTNPEEAAERTNFHSGRATSLIDHAVDAHLAFEPQWSRRPVGEGAEHRDRANRLEAGLGHVFSDAFLWSIQIPPKVNGKQLALHNYTQIFVGLENELVRRPTKKRGESQEDFERREWEWEARRFTWNPIRIEVPAPGTVLMDPGQKVPKFAIRHKTYRAYELESITTTKAEILDGVKVFRIEGDQDEEIEVVEWWTPAWYALKLKDGGDLLYVEENTWGFVPFAHAFSGDGDMPVKEKFNPEWFVRQSLLHTVMESLKMRDQAMWAHHQILQRTANTPYLYDGDPAEGAEALKGGVLPGTQRWGILQQPQLAAQHFQHLESLDAGIERDTYAMQAAGFRQSGVDTATQQIILSEATNRKFKAVVQQMGALYSIAGSYALRLVKRLSEEYGIDAIVVGDDPLQVQDIEDQYHVTANFEQVDVVAAMQEADMALKELNNDPPLISSDQYYRVRRYENPTEIRKGIFRDMVRFSPGPVSQGQAAALRELGWGELADEMEAQARMARMVGPDGESPLFGGQGQSLPRSPSGGQRAAQAPPRPATNGRQ